MPPKPNKKAAEKQKAKVIEDKTFGLKNKNKSAKVNRYVQQVNTQVQAAGNRKEREAAEQKKKEQEAKKKAEEAHKAELAELFKPIIQQKVPFGVDPKTVLCAHFKAGSCAKGARCKFSHDLNVERKSLKADVYTDVRKENPNETMEDWDQAKLEESVRQKFQDNDNLNKPTDIVCKFFIDAIESRKYGWFWECPNGNKCKYRHALPPGFVLKKKETEEERRSREEEEKENQITIEDFLETERHNLGPNLVMVTAETFAKWKSERKEREQNERDEAAKKRHEEFKKMKAGIKSGMAFSGKEFFDFNPEWAKDDGDDADAMDAYEREEASEHGDDENEPHARRQKDNRMDEHDGRGADDGMQVEDLDGDDGGGAGPSSVRVDADLFTGDDLAGLDDDEDDDDDNGDDDNGDNDR